MGELRADRWLHLVGTPTFLRPISRIEHDWWRPIVTLALILVIGIFLGLIGYLVIGLINTWLIQVLLLGEAPSWPPNVIAAATTSHIQCADCLMGGVTEAVMLAVMFAIWTAAVLLAAVALNHRPAMTWITAAPRFRWSEAFSRRREPGSRYSSWQDTPPAKAANRAGRPGSEAPRRSRSRV